MPTNDLLLINAVSTLGYFLCTTQLFTPLLKNLTFFNTMASSHLDISVTAIHDP